MQVQILLLSIEFLGQAVAHELVTLMYLVLDPLVHEHTLLVSLALAGHED